MQPWRFGNLPTRLLTLQSVTALASTLLLWGLRGTDGAVAAGSAGVVVVVPNAYFAWRLEAPVRSGERTAARLIVGRAVTKLLMTASLMVAAFVWLKPEPLAFFGTLVVVQAVHWLAPILDGPPRSRGDRPRGD